MKKYEKKYNSLIQSIKLKKIQNKARNLVIDIITFCVLKLR